MSTIPNTKRRGAIYWFRRSRRFPTVTVSAPVSLRTACPLLRSAPCGTTAWRACGMDDHRLHARSNSLRGGCQAVRVIPYMQPLAQSPVCRPRGEVSCHRQMVTVANDLPANGTNFSPPGRRYHTVQRLLMGHTGSSSSAASICTHRHPWQQCHHGQNTAFPGEIQWFD